MVRKLGVRALTLGLGCSFILISACSTNHEIRPRSVNDPHTNLVSEEQTDDPDLYFGDLGVEQQINAHRLRSLAAADPNKKALVDPNGFPLVKQHPNPSLHPDKKTYVESAIKTAESYIGTPYVYGSDRTEPSTFDCSDYTRWVFLTALGMDLPWDSRSQAAYVKAFSKKTYTSLNQAKRGDLLFFSSYRGNRAADYANLTPADKTITHVGIYMGNGKIIHCPSKKSGGVHIGTLTWRQLDNRFIFGGTILD
ncbi:NlpC/P60 family protein [Paenibacillus mesophilus]|uniref:C40 family peptidase n=1 Tax=Paenibacillus mesophilus TaxID=2582849 RepID=UPI00110DD6DE|nr:C40 family peptidase [Paenibacillus mesophilus]TMV50928.1 NlpC/P60 family protein [Paenibacillus mesophilus]